MRLTHIRYAKLDNTVLGFISIRDRQTIMILENYNEMVDEGFYHLVPFAGVKFKETFALVGADLSIYPENGTDRSTCVYHGGDTHEDTKGCPLVGVRFHFAGSTPDIDGGAEAMKILRTALVSDHMNYVNIIKRY
jgi:hypothetical protein